MKLLVTLSILASIGGVHLQCISPRDSENYRNAAFSTDLSGITDFSVDLYKQLAPGASGKNFFFSPYSIWTALTLSYFGSNGNTQRQLESSLRLNDKLTALKLWRSLETFYKNRQQNTSEYTFNAANQAYFHNTLNLMPFTKDLLQNELKTVNFRDVVGSAKDINEFAAKTTKGRISEVVTPTDLIDAVMVLVNAAFFKGTWKFQFKRSDTKQEDFFITEQDVAKLAMMSQKGSFRYGESRQLGARILELPYAGEAISMFVLLPTADRPLGDRFVNMVNNLNGASLRAAIDPRNMPLQTVNVKFPKFKFTMKLESNLKESLENMGIVDLFDGNKANMTCFDLNEDLAIDKTIHKSFVEVNEEGTEAAAVTALISLTRSSIPRVTTFHANEPFIFIIHDNQTKNVLFMGAIKNPRG